MKIFFPLYALFNSVQPCLQINVLHKVTFYKTDAKGNCETATAITSTFESWLFLSFYEQDIILVKFVISQYFTYLKASSPCTVRNGGSGLFCVTRPYDYKNVCPSGLTVKDDNKTCEDSKSYTFALRDICWAWLVKIAVSWEYHETAILTSQVFDQQVQSPGNLSQDDWMSGLSLPYSVFREWNHVVSLNSCN